MRKNDFLKSGGELHRSSVNAYCLFKGAPTDAGLTGAPPVLPASAASTFPLMRITLVGSFEAFEVIVTLLLIGPMRLVS